MTQVERIDPDRTDQVSFRVGKVADVEPLLTRFGAAFFSEVGFDRFTDFDLHHAVQVVTRQVATDASPFIVAEDHGESVGLIAYRLERVFGAEPFAYMWVIFVAPDYRQRGRGRSVASVLLHLACKQAKAEGACAFLATVPPPNTALCALFPAAGFESMGGAFIKGL
ncbi:MAG TPA: GNAT family N-acetyltransferase [Stellaceae bacterium]|jgi:ribosomal protein S18 acetylase RimI-like enzyme